MVFLSIRRAAMQGVFVGVAQRAVGAVKTFSKGCR